GLAPPAALTAAEAPAALLAESSGYPARENEGGPPAPAEAAAREILTPLRLRTPDGRELSLLGTVATFGFAGEVTTSELSIESLFPADAATADALTTLAEGGRT